MYFSVVCLALHEMAFHFCVKFFIFQENLRNKTEATKVILGLDSDILSYIMILNIQNVNILLN